jgi:DNA-binding transcriptional LysR family regulator
VRGRGRLAERFPADIGLRDLHLLSVLLRERNLTRAADLLGTTQPAISKVLARLRTQFEDPLFVWAGRAMQPTRRALELAEPLRAVLSSFEAMNRSSASFAPETSGREFRLLMTDVGMIVFLPRLTEHIRAAGAGLRLSAMPFDQRSFAGLLESGNADLAIGDMPNAAGGLRRQTLYTDHYLSVVRKSHPERASLARGRGFLAARHVLVQASHAGHSTHAALARVLEAVVPPVQVQLRLPSFMASAAVAQYADVVATMPAKLAGFAAAELDLAAFEPSVRLPPIKIAQLWHERMQTDPDHQWIRSQIFNIFHE